ncbi:MAG: sugar ABC transporter substrate-binding protein [Anaerolineae bacterium]|nr:sugar ABC transporter substrate-binding protein [Anaerolineae bacterium]
MKTLKSALLAILVSSLMMVAVAPGTGAQETVTITYAARAVADTELEMRDLLLANFQEAHPNIIVEREELPHADFWVKIPAEIAAGTGPDVISLPYLEQAVTFAAKGVLEPLDAYISGPNGIDPEEFLPDVLGFGNYAGQQLLLPQTVMLTAFAYNKDMFDAAGLEYPTNDWTWDEMLAAAKKLTLDRNGNTAESEAFDPTSIVQWGIYTWWWNSDFDQYLWTFGGDWLNEDATECTLNSPEAIAAITFYGDLTQQHHVAPYVRELAPAHGHPAFMEEQVAMFIIDHPRFPVVDASGVNWGVVHIPYKADVGSRSVFMFGDGIAMLKDSDQKEAAWELVKYLAGPEATQLLAEAGLGFSPYKSEIQPELSYPENIQVMREMLEAGWPRAILATDYAGMVVDPCNIIMEAVLSPGVTPDYEAIMQEANDVCNLALLDAPPLPR